MMSPRAFPLPPRSGGEGSGMGGANSAFEVSERVRSFLIAKLVGVAPPPTPDPSPPRRCAAREEGGALPVWEGTL